ncbi:DUF3035 domain-containing protein [Pseudooceanicola aestuarii]|uniref:DUF3035 domain-containing protein n=1 Tax=Pseudooceanicola aestuarii TaxID=2697319 RepID=UPI0013D5078F|nr:DUF3035 domain-containing protein [Pseudooceanicola aestuarii]
MALARGLIIVAILGLAACGERERDISLRSFHNPGGGPEEFAILPNKALEAPPSYAELPAPTPGQGNRTDLTPEADAVAALGGNPAALDNRGVAASDAALVAHAGRRGINPDIRPVLTEEDEDFRRRKSRFTKIRLFRVDRYYPAYKRQALDGQKEKQRWQNAGAPTPTAPPAVQ